MHLGPCCHHYVCFNDGLVLVVGWDVLILMCRGDNLKVIIIKLPSNRHSELSLNLELES
jgi:hypothetical protein